jgi:hypothetical protein
MLIFASRIIEERNNGILEQAESIAQGVLESIQAVAGTTDCKGVQIYDLI